MYATSFLSTIWNPPSRETIIVDHSLKYSQFLTDLVQSVCNQEIYLKKKAKASPAFLFPCLNCMLQLKTKLHYDQEKMYWEYACNKPVVLDIQYLSGTLLAIFSAKCTCPLTRLRAWPCKRKCCKSLWQVPLKSKEAIKGRPTWSRVHCGYMLGSIR